MDFLSLIPYSGRSWWQARYSDGRILSEWDTLVNEPLMPNKNGKSSRWEEVPKKGMVGLRLLCPNGMAGELGGPEGSKFFQLKVGYFDMSISGGGAQKTSGSHIIGIIIDGNGNCKCKAWDGKHLLNFNDNVFNMKYENLGQISLEAQGLRV